MNYTELKNILTNYNDIYIYGAGIIAYNIYEAITKLFNINIKSFLVTEKDDTDIINEVPIKLLSEIEDKNIYIFIATPEEYHSDIEKYLLKHGYSNYEKLTAKTEYILMGKYFRKILNFKFIEDYDLHENQHNKISTVYMAIHHLDKKLYKQYTENSYTKKIQVGASLTNDRLINLVDNAGDNISKKNLMYCELTATYWAWKNDICSDVIGIFHYRRVLNVSSEQITILYTDEADVILPLPFVCTPDTSGQFLRYLNKEDVGVMKTAIKEIHGSEVLNEINDIIKKPYLYGYNMFIAKKEVFCEYSNWIFPILEKMEEIDKDMDRKTVSRYMGRIGELLTSLYFIIHNEKWKIIHGEKVWRV